ncbi:polymer-forming cytoskeletal protein [Curvibacter sp. HBC61]|uniref:Polymer-forming cytoskeletal protein n=1 Tax=Curvibacter cyanobacteriorum TaxID=3026422 RepID=A0ABT5MU21_9BURK|nr:polymer-forming cytoskeletal protein [Curvibacter sp. HBC61]MDD0837541.1 polymer-forming cytoskeletal protein [Curvibacter sp. HBC61]
MALQPNFFSKRDPDVLPARTVPGHGTPSLQAASVTKPLATDVVATPVPAPVPGAAAAASPAADGGSKLTVGPNIKLKGVEITDCDTLFVEGMVEATMDSRLMQIAEQGSFRGAAEIDIAEIRGRFDGTLTARQKLVIHATGRVSGKIRYGKLVVEEGGQLLGEVDSGPASGRHAGAGDASAAPLALGAGSATDARSGPLATA